MGNKVVIVGGGFAGLNAAKVLNKTDFEITLIDKNNYHLFQPLLYQVATAALSPGDIATPIRAVVSKQLNTRVIMGEVISIDRENKKVILADGEFEYDYLILAPGARHSYFGNEMWEKYAPGLKTVADALTIREKVLYAFERAERLEDPYEIDKFMTFVIVGGGPTGVEMAGSIAEITKKTMLKDFRRIDPAQTKILLIEAGKRVLSTFDEKLSAKAREALESLGVTVITNSKVKEINNEGVKVNDIFIETPNIIWAAGNSASPLLKTLNSKLDTAGRVFVNKDCSIPEDPNVFVLGDSAHLADKNGVVLPGIAPVAIQQGKYVAKLIKNNLPIHERKPFKYFDKGNIATIGIAKAVLTISGFKLHGLIAWLMWVFIHVLYLISFRNRYKVLTEWIWYYISNRQGIRLITHKTNI